MGAADQMVERIVPTAAEVEVEQNGEPPRERPAELQRHRRPVLPGREGYDANGAGRHGRAGDDLAGARFQRPAPVGKRDRLGDSPDDERKVFGATESHLRRAEGDTKHETATLARLGSVRRVRGVRRQRQGQREAGPQLQAGHPTERVTGGGHVSIPKHRTCQAGATAVTLEEGLTA